MNQFDEKTEMILKKNLENRGEHTAVFEQVGFSFAEGRNSARESLSIACEALTNVLNQPFEGDWDAQAVFVQQIMAKLKSNGDWIEPRAGSDE